ncbi:hypothetical protein L53_01125 [Hyphomonas sp. L-53-1-40]|nr:hypothetical protein L53_01125 [Hyphomonas sp. L-53-1-40]
MPLMSTPNFAEAIVLRRAQLTPHMVRLTFQSEFATDFSPGAPGGYLKILAPAPGEVGPPPLDLQTAKRAMRTYTLRHVRPAENEFDVDFVVHGDEGIAGPWARLAKSGDRILVSRPGALKFSTEGANWHLFVADLSSIPAAAVELEALPSDAIGDAFFEIPSDEDRQPIRTPTGIRMHWIIKADPHAPSDALIHAVQNTDWHSGEPSVFVAGEFALAGALRTYFRKQQPTRKDLTYISSYWKLGLIEPEHKAFKAQVA